MKKKESRPGDAAELRRRAEKKVEADEAKTREKLSTGEARRVLHDLRVHQIELEMRNEELHRVLEEEVREVTKKYRALFDGSSNPIAVYDRDGYLLMINSLGAENFRRPAAEIVGKSLKELLPDAFELLVKRIRRVIAQNEPVRAEDLIRLPGGEERWFWSTLEPAKNANGSIYGVQVISYDITDRKRTEEALQRAHDQLEQLVAERTEKLNCANEVLRAEIAERKRTEDALRESEKKYRLLIDTANESVVVAQDGLLKLVNPATIDLMMGYSEQELMDRPFPEFIHPDDRDMVVENYRRRIANDAGAPRYSFRVVTRAGIVKWLEISATVIEWQGKPATLNFLTDITERKRAEETLRESEEQLRAFMENAPDGVYLNDLAGKFLYGNRRTEEIIGYKREEIIGKNMMELELLAPEGLAMAGELLQANDRGQSTGPDELTLNKKDGSRIIVEINTSVAQRHGQPVVIGFVRDITGRKQAEEELRESEKKYHEWFDFLPIPVYEMDLEANITAANRAIFETFRGTEDDFKKGVNAWKLLSPEDVKRSAKNVQRLLKGEQIEGTEYNFTRLDGSVFPAIVISSVIFDRGRPVGLRGAIIDITERKLAEEAVQASLREKEILLREIHHRVKNNMQVISSLFNLQSGHIKDENAHRMLKEGQLRIRSMALVHEKLYQSRNLSKIDFADYLRSLAEHLFQFFRVEADRIRLETDLEAVHLNINSAVPCGLLVTELVTNALKHAFPGDRNGVVRIELHLGEDKTVELRVADDGVGFPEAVDFRLTETLGLQIVTLLADQLGGTIELDRKKGTAFTIAFRELEYEART